MLPCSLKMVVTFFGSMPMALVEGGGVDLADLVDDEFVSSFAHQPSFCLATSKVLVASNVPSIGSRRVSVIIPSGCRGTAHFHSVAARVTPPL